MLCKILHLHSSREVGVGEVNFTGVFFGGVKNTHLRCLQNWRTILDAEFQVILSHFVQILSADLPPGSLVPFSLGWQNHVANTVASSSPRSWRKWGADMRWTCGFDLGFWCSGHRWLSVITTIITSLCVYKEDPELESTCNFWGDRHLGMARYLYIYIFIYIYLFIIYLFICIHTSSPPAGIIGEQCYRVLGKEDEEFHPVMWCSPWRWWFSIPAARFHGNLRGPQGHPIKGNQWLIVP